MIYNAVYNVKFFTDYFSKIQFLTNERLLFDQRCIPGAYRIVPPKKRKIPKRSCAHPPSLSLSLSSFHRARSAANGSGHASERRAIDLDLIKKCLTSARLLPAPPLRVNIPRGRGGRIPRSISLTCRRAITLRNEDKNIAPPVRIQLRSRSRN